MTSPVSERPTAGSGPERSSRRTSWWVFVPATAFAAMVLLAIAGSWLAPHGVTDPVATPFARDAGLLGADRLGRDVWSRLLGGGGPVLLASSIATGVATALGVPAGVLLAGRSTRMSRLGRRALDVAIVVPPLAVLLVVLARVDDSTLIIGIVIGLIGAPIAGRVALAASDPVWRRSHVEQAVLRGERRTWIALNEVAPSIVGPLVADAGLRFAAAVSVSSAVNVLGYGPEPPATDWASQLVENLSGASLNPWAAVAPALAITLLAVSANLTADTVARRCAR